MPNRIQALVVTCLFAGGLAGGGALSVGTGEADMQAKSDSQPLAVRAQASRMETGERLEGRYCRPVLPESLVGKADRDRVLSDKCIEDSRRRFARLST